MSLILPPRFLLRVAYRCPFVAEMPRDGESLVEIPEAGRLDPLTEPGEMAAFADVRLGWNKAGLGVQMTVAGKQAPPLGDASRPLGSDGLTLWIDTRADRAAHRASRYCHQFHFLPVAGGPPDDGPAFLQAKVNRALQDAPLAAAGDVAFRCERTKSRNRVEAFIPASALNGYDPDEHPTLGVFYAVKDLELGEQTLGLSADFPYGEDPSLWSGLDLARAD